MFQIKRNLFDWWAIYIKHVGKVVLNNEFASSDKIPYWRNAVFCKILTYLIPLSIIALIPSVLVAFINGVPEVGFADLFVFFSSILITFVPGIKLEIRKSIFIALLYSLSLILLYFLPLPAPGLLFLLAITIFSSLIYSSSAAYLSAWLNLVICLCFALLFYFELAPSNALIYSFEVWIAVSSNLVLLSFACAICLDFLLAGLNNSLIKHQEYEIERAKITNDLLQRNRDLEQFTFIISHNLRAPTANIIGFSEFLQDETLAIQEQKELLNGLATSVAGLDTIIKDINSILQVKYVVNEKKEKIIFSKLVDEIMSSFISTIKEHNVQLKIDFSEVDEIFSLKVYLRSIFYNLISNSIKYRKTDEQTLIKITSRKENNKIILSFKDNGLGIDMKTKGDKVFGLYKRFHAHVEGKGMGLFMVKTQVEAIGGRINVESEPNNGSEFTIIFEN